MASSGFFNQKTASSASKNTSSSKYVQPQHDVRHSFAQADSNCSDVVSSSTCTAKDTANTGIGVTYVVTQGGLNYYSQTATGGTTVTSGLATTDANTGLLVLSPDNQTTYDLSNNSMHMKHNLTVEPMVGAPAFIMNSPSMTGYQIVSVQMIDGSAFDAAHNPLSAFDESLYSGYNIMIQDTTAQTIDPASCLNLQMFLNYSTHAAVGLGLDNIQVKETDATSYAAQGDVAVTTSSVTLTDVAFYLSGAYTGGQPFTVSYNGAGAPIFDITMYDEAGAAVDLQVLLNAAVSSQSATTLSSHAFTVGMHDSVPYFLDSMSFSGGGFTLSDMGFGIMNAA